MGFIPDNLSSFVLHPTQPLIKSSLLFSAPAVESLFSIKLTNHREGL